MQGNISGYGVHIRALTTEDVRIHRVNVGGVPVGECIAVDGSDLGPCLAAVVHVPTGRLLWSDADAQGTPIAAGAQFAQAVITVTRGVLGTYVQV